MVSDIQLNQKQSLQWIEGIIETFGETEHTNKLLSFLYADSRTILPAL